MNSRLVLSTLLLALSTLLSACFTTHTSFQTSERLHDIEAGLPGGDSLVGINVSLWYENARFPSVELLVTRRGSVSIEVEALEVQAICSTSAESYPLDHIGLIGSHAPVFGLDRKISVASLSLLAPSLRTLGEKSSRQSLYLTSFFESPSTKVAEIVVHLRAQLMVGGKRLVVMREFRMEKKTTVSFCFGRCC